jgi:quercetin dioxygenase-like cupin family protein
VTTVDTDGLAVDSPYEGVERRAMHSDGASIYWYAFQPGAAFPQHRHAQEQVTIVQEGEITLRTADGEQQLSAGTAVVSPPWEEHGISARTAARFMIVLTPRRAEGEGVEVLA